MTQKQLETDTDLMSFTASKLKAQSDDLLREFNEIVETETTQLEDISEKSYKLMDIFEQDSHQMSEQLDANIKSLEDFQQQFDKLKDNFDEIEQLNNKSKLMKQMVKKIVKRYDKRLEDKQTAYEYAQFGAKKQQN